jgi:hypothetical protein
MGKKVMSYAMQGDNNGKVGSLSPVEKAMARARNPPKKKTVVNRADGVAITIDRAAADLAGVVKRLEELREMERFFSSKLRDTRYYKEFVEKEGREKARMSILLNQFKSTRGYMNSAIQKKADIDATINRIEKATPRTNLFNKHTKSPKEHSRWLEETHANKVTWLRQRNIFIDQIVTRKRQLDGIDQEIFASRQCMGALLLRLTPLTRATHQHLSDIRTNITELELRQDVIQNYMVGTLERQGGSMLTSGV